MGQVDRRRGPRDRGVQFGRLDDAGLQQWSQPSGVALYEHVAQGLEPIGSLDRGG